MAYGPVNVPGSAGAELETVRTLASTALDTANTANSSASKAQATADAALEAANNAQSSANAAQSTADSAASQAATNASDIATIKETADTALETANEAKQLATEANTAAANAQTAASDALNLITTINSTIGSLPTQNGTLTYTGSELSPTWNNYDTDKLTIGGTTSGTDVGTYTATFTPTGDYVWSDGTQNTVEVAWTISRATITLPTQSGTLTYTGSAQSPTWSNYDSTKMTIGGTTSGTNAGSYTATFTPGDNYQWSDGTTTAKSVTWSIGKAAGSLTLNKTSMTLDSSSMTGTITVTRSGDGTISATSSNTSAATVSVSGTTVTVTAKASGSATITVSVAEGTNYLAPSGKTCSVTVDLPSTTLADNTPAQIQAVAQAGTASSYWSVGDTIGIALSGTVGSLTLSGTYYAYIIGFNHNSSIEGTNSIHFQFGKTSSGTSIAFVDSTYGSSSSSACFHMNSSNSNSGGWASSYMRQTICASFLSAMPTAWQNVIASCTKYSDNTGGGSNTASYVTSTSDKIWLLAECEVFGSSYGYSGSGYSNDAEKNYVSQYTYYANGNSKVKYQHSSTGSTCRWWLRSVRASSSNFFCRVSPGGGASNSDAYYSDGFAPGFKVA